MYLRHYMLTQRALENGLYWGMPSAEDAVLRIAAATGERELLDKYRGKVPKFEIYHTLFSGSARSAQLSAAQKLWLNCEFSEPIVIGKALDGPSPDPAARLLLELLRDCVHEGKPHFDMRMKWLLEPCRCSSDPLDNKLCEPCGRRRLLQRHNWNLETLKARTKEVLTEDPSSVRSDRCEVIEELDLALHGGLMGDPALCACLYSLLTSDQPDVTTYIFERLSERWRPGLIAACQTHGVRLDQLEDVQQEVATRVIAGLPAVARPATFGHWLRIVVQRAADRYLAKERAAAPVLHQRSGEPDDRRASLAPYIAKLAELRACARNSPPTDDDALTEIVRSRHGPLGLRLLERRAQGRRLEQFAMEEGVTIDVVKKLSSSIKLTKAEIRMVRRRFGDVAVRYLATQAAAGSLAGFARSEGLSAAQLQALDVSVRQLQEQFRAVLRRHGAVGGRLFEHLVMGRSLEDFARDQRLDLESIRALAKAIDETLRELVREDEIQ